MANRIVEPDVASACMVDQNSRRVAMSMAAVGSSRMSRSGSGSRARAKRSRCCSPPEHRPTRRLAIPARTAGAVRRVGCHDSTHDFRHGLVLNAGFWDAWHMPSRRRRMMPPRLAAALAAVAVVVPRTRGGRADRADLAGGSRPGLLPRGGPCPETETTPGAVCAAVTVPQDYSQPDGDTIDVTVSKLPARDPGPRRGSLFGNPRRCRSPASLSSPATSWISATR